MAKANQWSKTATATKSKSMNVASINLKVDESDSSETDFEPDDEPVLVLKPMAEKQKAQHTSEWRDWEDLFQHLLEFSEDILPTALYDPMKWCHVSIHEALKHIAKTEEILRSVSSNDVERMVLERNLEAWKRHQQTSISKSRLSYSLYLYKHAGDIFYFAFYQNRAILPEIREHLDPAFEAQFGSSRLTQTRALLKLYLGQYSQIEDFLSMLPEIYRSEVLAGIICDYLNPQVKDEKGVVEERVNELLSSPDYHENQVTLMILTRDDCLFKAIILDCMFKYMITEALESSVTASTSTSRSMTIKKMDNSPSSFSEDQIRYRHKLFLKAEPDLLAKACVATENLPTSLFDIIAYGLDTISRKVSWNRSKIFEDFRPPLFDDNDPALSLPAEYLRFFHKMKQVPSSYTILDRVKTAFSKAGRCNNINTSFWLELLVLLSE